MGIFDLSKGTAKFAKFAQSSQADLCELCTWIWRTLRFPLQPIYLAMNAVAKTDDVEVDEKTQSPLGKSEITE